MTTRLGALEQETAKLKKQLADGTQNTLASGNALKDTHRQELASLKDNVAFLSQRARSIYWGYELIHVPGLLGSSHSTT